MELINYIIASIFKEDGETVPVDQDNGTGGYSSCVIA
jgi:hypothetical protein